MTPATAMIHMNPKRQHIRSTKKEIKSDLEDGIATPARSGVKTHLIYAWVIDQGKLYTDLTGRFTARSSKGNWYAKIYYSYDCNYVKPVPIKSRSESGRLKTYGDIHQELTARGFKPKLKTLDNVALSALKITLRKTTWNSYCPPRTVTDAMPWIPPSELSKNTSLKA
jgi:hypothetical protein